MNIQMSEVRPVGNRILVSDMEFGTVKTKNGIILKDDDGTIDGIRSRWARVVAIGEKQKDVQVGDYVLVEHGRWTRGVEVFQENEKKKIHMIDFEKGLMLVSKDKPAVLELVGL